MYCHNSMKKMPRVLVLIVAAISLMGCLTGCEHKIKEDKFKSILETEIGNVPDVSVVQFDYNDNGETVKNLRLAGGVGYKDKMVVDKICTDKYVNDFLGKRKYKYTCLYILSDNLDTAKEMRESYIRSIENLSWKLVDPSDYRPSTSSGWDGDLYIYENHAMYIDKAQGPYYWDVPQDSGETLYGIVVDFY